MNKDSYIVNEGSIVPPCLPVEYGDITLRDYFAAAALQGLMDSMIDPLRAADLAYRVADAMLEARTGAAEVKV